MDFSWLCLPMNRACLLHILFFEQDKSAKRDMQPAKAACIHQIMLLRCSKAILLNGLLTPSSQTATLRARPTGPGHTIKFDGPMLPLFKGLFFSSSRIF
jgi:hypothetical protein